MANLKEGLGPNAVRSSGPYYSLPVRQVPESHVVPDLGSQMEIPPNDLAGRNIYKDNVHKFSYWLSIYL